MSYGLKDILEIRPGETRCFPCESAMQCRSVRALAWYVGRYKELPEGVKGYRTRIDFNSNVLMVKAEKVD